MSDSVCKMDAWTWWRDFDDWNDGEDSIETLEGKIEILQYYARLCGENSEGSNDE